MPDPTNRFDRQAAWQRARRELSWPAKIRMVEAVRDSILELRRGGLDAKSREDRGPKTPVSGDSSE